MEEDYTYPRSKRLISDQTSSTLSTAPSSDANPAAEMLQDMIREKRAKSQRTKKAFDPVSRLAGGDTSDLKETQSSPVTSLSSRTRPSMTARRASGVNGKPTVQKEMGLREMSEHISKVDKQNFDLKLEVFHRRQRNDALEARIEKLEAYEADYEDLQAKYTALMLESDRQRLVLDDAVAQICELQAENEELQATVGGHFAGIFDQEAGNQVLGQISSTNGHPLPSTPPQAVKEVSQPSRNNRQNSVMSSKSSASRRNMLEIPLHAKNPRSETGSHSLYSSGDSMNQGNGSLLSVNRTGSVFSGDEEDISIDRQMLHSPRLSILSESGFSSIYGSPYDHAKSATHADEDDSSSPPSSEVESTNYPNHTAQRDAEIDLWIQESPTAPKSGKRSPKTKAKTNQQYTSIEEVLSKRPVRPSEEVTVPHVQIPPRQSSSAERAHRGQRRLEMKSPPKSPSQKPRSYSSSNGSLVLGGKMPPTPDTMSTTTIGGPSSSTQSIITEKSMLDYSGPPSKGYANLVNYGRPRTSDSDAFHPTAHHSKSFDREGEVGMKRSHENADASAVTAKNHGHDRSVDSALVDGPVDSVQFAAKSNMRPVLTSYQTDMMFNGDGFALVQPSRTFSYPSPRRRPEDTSAQLPRISPTKDRKPKSSETSEIRPQAMVSNDAEDPREAITNRTKDYLVKNKLPFTRTQHSGGETEPPVNVHQQSGEASRSRFGRFQFFRRTNSQNAGNKSNSQATSPRRPRNVRSQSSTRAQPSLPKRHTSNGSRPGTSDGSAPTTIPRPSQSSSSRRHSAILDHAASFLPGGTASRDHNRHLSETRPVFRTEDSNSKWPLGRTTSAKIKEGLGMKRT